MAELTVGYVSGIVALFVFLVQFFIPSLFAFITAGILRDQETAAAWTAVTPLLQQSLWTKVLRTDVSRSDGVRRSIAFAIYATTGVAVLTAITGVITPLGLYDAFQESSAQTSQFGYVQDRSSFSMALTPRSNESFTRVCRRNGALPVPCPYTDTIVRLTADSSSSNLTGTADYPYGYDVTVPQILRDIYSSGTSGPTTVSNFFDIEWRQIRQIITNRINNDSEYSIGGFRQIDSLVLDDAVRLVEGLVVDTRNGGIGFRNHTVPLDTAHGATWQEDLLFVEPETVCVDTNLTLEFRMTQSIDYPDQINGSGIDFNSVAELFLVDNGGFSDLELNRTSIDQDSQRDPQLALRAHEGARLNNMYTMFMLNISSPENLQSRFLSFSPPNSTRGQRFSLPTNSLSDSLQHLGISNTYGGYIQNAAQASEESGSSASINDLFDVGDGDLIFADARAACMGIPLVANEVTGTLYTTENVTSNISTIYVGCGLVQGAPQRIDGNAYFGVDRSGAWSVPLYSCASATKAKVKEVTFRLNGTSDFANLQVVSSRDKVYSEESEMPLWGVESSSLNVNDFKSIWGLIDPAYEGFESISTVRKAELYLPGRISALVSAGFVESVGYNSNLPGYDFPGQSMESVYSSSDDSSGLIADYSGTRSLAMAMRWQDLSSSASNASRIIDLIWTDIAANAVTGSKGTLGPGNAGSSSTTTPILVNPTVRRIRYRLLYAIPGFILCAVLAAIALATILSAVLGRSSPRIVKRRLHQTSTGRLLATAFYPQRSNLAMSSKQWSKANGSTKIDLSVKDTSQAQSNTSPYNGSSTGVPEEATALREGPQKHEGADFSGYRY